MNAPSHQKDWKERVSKPVLGLFAGMLLFSAYKLANLPFTLKSEGNMASLDLAMPILINLYVVLAITFGVALFLIYLGRETTRTIIISKERSNQSGNAGASRESDGSLATTLSVAEIKTGSNAAMLKSGFEHLCAKLEAVAGACYETKITETETNLEIITGFALPVSESAEIKFPFGEGLVGQAARNAKSILIDEIPEGYAKVVSGLGQASPKNIFILPIVKNQQVLGAMEVATFKTLPASVKEKAEAWASDLANRMN